MTITLTRDAFNAIMRTCKDVAKGSHYVGLDRDTLRLICRDSRVTAVALNNASIVEVTVPCEQPSDDGEMLVPVLKRFCQKTNVRCALYVSIRISCVRQSPQ